jgi:hypothetical protein
MMHSRRAVAVEPVLRAFLRGGLSAPPFGEAFVAVAPETSGVYFLYRDGRLIYIGIAVHGTGIRQELEKHLNGAYGACTAAATTFDFEQTRDPVVASREYLLAHAAQHRGRLPLYNRNHSLHER